MSAMRQALSRTALIARLTTSALLSSTVLFAPIAQAVPPQIKTQAPGYYRMMLGDFEITAVSDGTITIPIDTLLTRTTPAAVQKRLAAQFLKPQLETSINTYLIHTGSRLILVDTGAGDYFKGKGGGQLITNLKAAGYQPEDIDAILLTHIHGDHSGGLSAFGKALFPNAVVYVDQRETEFWLNPANEEHAAENQKHGFAKAAEMLAPYQAAGRVKTFHGNTQLFPGVSSVSSYGHTPGHSFYAIESQGQQLQLWGDLLHAREIQFATPGVTIKFDVNSEAAAVQREKAFADAARQGYWVGAAHISFPGIGHILKAGKGYNWIPANYSSKP